MTLARTLGFVTRQRMYAALTAPELIELEIAYGLDPWGPERQETLHGILCSLIDACHRMKGTVKAPLDYMPFVRALKGEEPGQTEEQMKEIWKSVVADWNS